MMKKCERCEGRKKCMGMGHMRVDCPSCKGTGNHIEIVKKTPGDEKAKTKRELRKAAVNIDQ